MGTTDVSAINLVGKHVGRGYFKDSYTGVTRANPTKPIPSTHLPSAHTGLESSSYTYVNKNGDSVEIANPQDNDQGIYADPIRPVPSTDINGSTGSEDFKHFRSHVTGSTLHERGWGNGKFFKYDGPVNGPDENSKYTYVNKNGGSVQITHHHDKDHYTDMTSKGGYHLREQRQGSNLHEYGHGHGKLDIYNGPADGPSDDSHYTSVHKDGKSVDRMQHHDKDNFLHIKRHLDGFKLWVQHMIHGHDPSKSIAGL